MEIIVTDRAAIEAGILVRFAYVVISIHDAHKRRAKIPLQSGLRDILFLAFHDAEPTTEMTVPEEIRMMTPQQAEQICDFVDKHKAEVGAIVVHCEQGMSRSPAVAAAISDALGLDPCRFWQDYAPNRHVYDTVSDAFEKRNGTGGAGATRGV